MAYRVTIWGTRGSIPTPGPGTTRYGGNTPCLALRHDGDERRIVILDAGTGMRELGLGLTGNGRGTVVADLLLSHTHWDHIQGLPHFAPFFAAGNTIRIWGARQGGTDLEDIIREQMKPVVFPVPLDQVAASLSVEHVAPGEFTIEDFRVRAMRVRHPGTTLAYVLTPTGGGKTLAYVSDNELSGGTYEVDPDWRDAFVDFLGGVDVLIHDAMFNPEELPRYAGWGHSSNVEAVELAVEAGVRTLVLFHHRPEHEDGTIDAMLEQARDHASRQGGGLEVVAAHEGMKLDL